MSDTLFLKIINREIPADIVYETDEVLGFRDINPVAPTHILVIPKKHIISVSEATENDGELLGALLLAAKDIAEKEDLEHYRLVINNGVGAGQSVFHLHLHIIGGRDLSWPPG